MRAHASLWTFNFGTLIITLSKAVFATLTFLRASGLGGQISTKTSLLRSTSFTFHFSLILSIPATLKTSNVSEP